MFEMRNTTLVLFVAIACIGYGLPANAKGRFTTFDPPGSVLTVARSISEGAIAGNYQDANSTTHGFLRRTDGTITSFDPPKSAYTESIPAPSPAPISTPTMCFTAICAARKSAFALISAGEPAVSRLTRVAGSNPGRRARPKQKVELRNHRL